ncbi:MAG TPA: hypothetical protein VKA60_03810 [Blastocatellia bacterium]|nr:hypothetical protein [Blastocatellia bacterium]
MTILQIILFVVGLALLLLATALVRAIRMRRAVKQAQATGATVKDLATGKPLEFGTKPAYVKITAVDVIYALAMLVGIAAKEIWDSLNETGKLKLHPARLIGAILISPVIYAAVYSKFVQGEVTLLGLALAFQNGFFWQAVFRSVQASAEAPPTH